MIRRLAIPITINCFFVMTVLAICFVSLKSPKEEFETQFLPNRVDEEAAYIIDGEYAIFKISTSDGYTFKRLKLEDLVVVQLNNSDSPEFLKEQEDGTYKVYLMKEEIW